MSLRVQSAISIPESRSEGDGADGCRTGRRVLLDLYVVFACKSVWADSLIAQTVKLLVQGARGHVTHSVSESDRGRSHSSDAVRRISTHMLNPPAERGMTRFTSCIPIRFAVNLCSVRAHTEHTVEYAMGWSAALSAPAA